MCFQGQYFTGGIFQTTLERDKHKMNYFHRYNTLFISISSLAPCAPTVLNVRMQKIGQTHWAMASWDSVNCSDVEYLVEITGQIQNSPQTLMEVSSYWLLTTYYELPMPCSTVYNLTVRSRNSAGVSEPSSAFSGVTGNFIVKLSLSLYSFFINTLGGSSNLVQTST